MCAILTRIMEPLALEGKTGRRVVPLATAAIAFFKAQTKDKLAGALMFSQAHGIA